MIECTDEKSETLSSKGHRCCCLGSLKVELEHETESRIVAEKKYEGLQREYDEFSEAFEREKTNPESKYDAMIENQLHLNEKLRKQIEDAELKVQELTNGLKNLHCCGKECRHCMADLIIDYEALTLRQLSREVKRLERLYFDVKSQMDRLLWRIDCEAKDICEMKDQLRRLKLDLNHLKNINDQMTRCLWRS